MLKITIGGAQGSGKTTAAGVITEALVRAGYLVENDGDVLLVTQKPNTFAEARKAIGMMPPAISGSGGHAALFAVARTLLAQDFALSDPVAWKLLLEYNKRCEPPWSEKELRHKLDQARATQAR